MIQVKGVEDLATLRVCYGRGHAPGAQDTAVGKTQKPQSHDLRGKQIRPWWLSGNGHRKEGNKEGDGEQGKRGTATLY